MTASASTPHIAPGDAPIAPTVLLPGDPLRARFIAETYLDEPVQFNAVRNMLGFSGTVRGRPVSVMGTGMGIPSISIYAHELVHTFGATRLIRVGTCGAIHPDLELYDIVVAQGASTDSGVLAHYGLPGTFAPLASYPLLERLGRAAADRGRELHVGNVLSSDLFYDPDPDAARRWARMGVLAIEMETAGLYAIAAAAGVEALGLFTVSDLVFSDDAGTTPEERQTAFTGMVELALDLV